MIFIKRTNIVSVLLCMLCTFINVNGMETVTIVNPANSATVSGSPLVINGTSSEANALVRLRLDSIDIGTVQTDAYGDWSFELSGGNNGSYTLYATLMTNSFDMLATTNNSFTIENPESIVILAPTHDQAVLYNPLTISGVSSLPSTTVRISLDSVVVATTTTDSNGDWSTSCTLNSNGLRTLLAELIVSGYPVASATITIDAQIPVIFPTGKSQVRVVGGIAPTTGSGTGTAYTYSVSGSIVTINFVPAFGATPAITATGLRTSGSSTVTVTSISATAATIAFSTGTQNISFTASLFT